MSGAFDRIPAKLLARRTGVTAERVAEYGVAEYSVGSPQHSRRPWRSHQLELFHLFEKLAAIDNVIELDGRFTAAEVTDQFFQSIAWIVGMNADRAQVSGISEAGEKFRQREASFEGQSSCLVRPAHEILNQKKLIKEGRRQKQAAMIDLPTSRNRGKGPDPRR